MAAIVRAKLTTDWCIQQPPLPIFFVQVICHLVAAPIMPHILSCTAKIVSQFKASILDLFADSDMSAHALQWHIHRCPRHMMDIWDSLLLFASQWTPTDIVLFSAILANPLIQKTGFTRMSGQVEHHIAVGYPSVAKAIQNKKSLFRGAQ